jgi:hypothetical protein
LIPIRDGRAKTFSHRIRICTFSQSSSHRTAFAPRSHFAFASHFSHIFRIFALSSPFFVILRYFTVNAPKSCEKMLEICKKKCENGKNAKSAKNCKMRMRCENGIKIRIASHYCEENFSHFRIFSHRIRIALPSLIPITAFINV